MVHLEDVKTIIDNFSVSPEATLENLRGLRDHIEHLIDSLIEDAE